MKWRQSYKPIVPCNPDNQIDCFRLVKRTVNCIPNLQHGELLEDSKYIFIMNKTNHQLEINGIEVIKAMSMLRGIIKHKKLYIPWVLARCTIIPI